MGQPDNGKEMEQVDSLDLSSNFHLALSPRVLKWKNMGKLQKAFSSQMTRDSGPPTGVGSIFKENCRAKKVYSDTKGCFRV